jgi:ankyrin repeat protein
VGFDTTWAALSPTPLRQQVHSKVSPRRAVYAVQRCGVACVRTDHQGLEKRLNTQAAWLQRALLAAGAEVDHANNLGETALYGAAFHGQVEAIRALLQAGADINRADNTGETALHQAAECGRVEAVRALLQAGADINRADNNGRTPLAIARAKNHEAAVLALVQAGATE